MENQRNVLQALLSQSIALRILLFLFSCSLFAHPPIEIVYHVATLNRWEEIVQEQLQTLVSSQLAHAADRITMVVVGPHIKKTEELIQKTSFAHKIQLIHFSENPRFCEFPGIEMVQTIAKEKPEAHILYLHSKGVSYLDPDKARNVQSWRRFMEYFTIERWQDCMESLETSNMCGVEWLNCHHTSSQKIEQPGMFAGNFWWARADYLRTCPPMQGTHLGPDWCFQHRFDCELFITTGSNPTPKSFHQSCVNMYEFNYASEYYKTEPVLENPIEIIYHIVATKEWLSSFQKQLHLLHTSGLLSSCHRLTAILLGSEIEPVQQLLIQSPFAAKINIIHANSQLHLGEFPSIEMIKAIVHRQPTAKICYLHNHTPETFVKPSTSLVQILYQKYLQTKKQIRNWAHKLLGKAPPTNLTITCWKECLQALQTSDLCGLKWKKRSPTGSHFPDVLCRGYFTDHSWWANAQYLKTCQNPHFRSPYHLYHTHWSRSWLRQYFADCQMFAGTSPHEPIVHELIR